MPISAKLACIVWLSFLDLETFSHFFKTPDIRASTRKDTDQHRRTRSSGCWRNRSWQLHGLKILLLSEMSQKLSRRTLVNLYVRHNESLTRQPTLATKILSARNQLVSSIRNYREINRRKLPNDTRRTEQRPTELCYHTDSRTAELTNLCNSNNNTMWLAWNSYLRKRSHMHTTTL